MTTTSGSTFTADPGLNLKLEVVKNLVDPGVDEGVKFFDRYRLKEDEDGDWQISPYSKLAKLAETRYGDDFMTTGQELDPEDFEDWTFHAQVEPKTAPGGKELKGSMTNFKTIRRVPQAQEQG